MARAIKVSVNYPKGHYTTPPLLPSQFPAGRVFYFSYTSL